MRYTCVSERIFSGTNARTGATALSLASTRVGWKGSAQRVWGYFDVPGGGPKQVRFLRLEQLLYFRRIEIRFGNECRGQVDPRWRRLSLQLLYQCLHGFKTHVVGVLRHQRLDGSAA